MKKTTINSTRMITTATTTTEIKTAELYRFAPPPSSLEQEVGSSEVVGIEVVALSVESIDNIIEPQSYELTDFIAQTCNHTHNIYFMQLLFSAVIGIGR